MRAFPQEIRRNRGLWQEELGFDSGYHRTYISILERGHKNPTLSTIDLAETLRCQHEKLSELEARLK